MKRFLNQFLWIFKYHLLPPLGELEIISKFQQVSTKPAIACSKLTIETLEQVVKYVKS